MWKEGKEIEEGEEDEDDGFSSIVDNRLDVVAFFCDFEGKETRGMKY
jgi:hypothetical protein